MAQSRYIKYLMKTNFIWSLYYRLMTIYGYTVDIVAKLFILFACGVPNDSSALAATRIFPYSLHIHEYIMTK